MTISWYLPKMLKQCLKITKNVSFTVFTLYGALGFKVEIIGFLYNCSKPAVCSLPFIPLPSKRWLTSVEYDGSVSYARPLLLCSPGLGLFNFLAEAIRGSPTLWLMVHVLVSFVLKSELSCFLPSAKTRVSRTV